MKAVKQYTPEVTLEQIHAFKKGKPETYTNCKLVNDVLEACDDPAVLAGGELPAYLGIESKHLAAALEVLTGMKTNSLRAELIADRWHKYKAVHPHCKEIEIARHLGFVDSSALTKFMNRNKHRFPELYLEEEERENRMKVLVDQIMPKEDAIVRRIYVSLPYAGAPKEQEACLRLLYRHARNVANLALEIAHRKPELLQPHDIIHVESCALLHNIGIVKTYMPELHCYGKMPYFTHGFLGSEILLRHRLKAESLSASSHLGSGIPPVETFKLQSPIGVSEPMQPLDQLICYASSFYSIFNPDHRRSVEEIRATLAKYGEPAVQRFDKLHKMFA